MNNRGRQIKVTKAEREASEDVTVDFDKLLSSITPSNNSSSLIERLASETINAILKDNLQPTPGNYAIYFDRALETKSKLIKDEIHPTLEEERDTKDEQHLHGQIKMNGAIFHVKETLDASALFYQNACLAKKIFNSSIEKIDSTSSSSEIFLFARNRDVKISEAVFALEKSIEKIRKSYKEAKVAAEDVRASGFYDLKYNIYGKRYVLEKIRAECKRAERYKFESSIVAIRIKQDKNNVFDRKTTIALNKSIVKIIGKTTRRSDMLGSIKDDIFVVMLRHTNIAGAKNFTAKIYEMLVSANFFIEGKEISFEPEIGSMELNIEFPAEENLKMVIATMCNIVSDDLDPKEAY
jgi:diguanylate cyclase